VLRGRGNRRNKTVRPLLDHHHHICLGPEKLRIACRWKRILPRFFAEDPSVNERNLEVWDWVSHAFTSVVVTLQQHHALLNPVLLEKTVLQ